MNSEYKPRHITCPFCESGKLVPLGGDFARCAECGMPLVGSIWKTLREIVALPEALGSHPCECGHPEMRLLPDGIFHCPACGSEVLPTKTVPRKRRTTRNEASAKSGHKKLTADS